MPIGHAEAVNPDIIMITCKRLFFLTAILLLSANFASAENKNKILAGKPEKPRFTVKDIEWPEKFGDASVCLWKDDAIAAFSLTIDDNCAPDHEWWLETGKKYGFPITWFVITDRISGTNSFNGTWEGYKKLIDAGNDVGSHTAMHLHIDEPGWKDIETEYADSKKDIEENIKGHKAFVLAFPGGPNTKLNDQEIAAKYYIGCRAGSAAINPANMINYTSINSIGAINIGNAQFESQDLLTALEKGRAKRAQFYRGWYCCHFHLVKPELREELSKPFEFLAAKIKSDELWAGLFRDIAMYGQERDTAKLTVKEVAKDKIVLSLNDEMDDSIFNYPLTVKVRLEPSWKSAEAMQDSKKVKCRLVTNNGGNYALIQVVPDIGDVTVTGK
ncbi:MAG TPA: hypothetical protein DCZ94_20985 [Lentisphaeria bacterium]|nr:MAG: hypothetical protein A2X48_23190 [Lentisphaerae bacterium GWF2_49_21]HBC89421.1 hypothetical protein [Lentisphaeria bacterium]